MNKEEPIKDDSSIRIQYTYTNTPYNITDIIDIIEGGKMERSPNSLYMAGDVLTLFRTYAQSIPNKKTYELVEMALIEYVKNHPAENFIHPIQLTLQGKIQGVKGRIRLKILRDRIEGYVEVLERLKKTGGGSPGVFKERLIKAVEEVIKVDDLPHDMVELLERVEEHI